MATVPVITAAESACALGNDLQACVARIERRESGLQPLAGVLESQGEFSRLLGGWIPDRRVLLGRRYGAASNAAIWVSQAVVRSAGWTAADLKDAWLFVGSSRGNAGELFGAYPQRRPIKRFRASNLMHSEIGAAVSIELGIKGPWQVFSNGCASGLDALGFGCMALNARATQRVLVVAVDLPLVPELLSAFRASGVLTTNSVNDPYSPHTTGFLPGEAAVAVTLELGPASRGWCSVEGYSSTSDAYDPIGLADDGGSMADCMRLAVGAGMPISAVCPHATGTVSHARAELAAVDQILDTPTRCILLKPYTGHTLGASGLLDTALLAAFMKKGFFLQNLPNLCCGSSKVLLESHSSALPPQARILKLSVGMGGHNAAVVLRSGKHGREDTRSTA